MRETREQLLTRLAALLRVLANAMTANYFRQSDLPQHVMGMQ